MRTQRDSHPDGRRQGSAVPVVVILLIGTSLILGSVLRFAVTETRLNKNHELWIEAKFIAEAISEYGFAELRDRFDRNTSFPVDGLLPKVGSNPLELPDHFYNFYQDSGSQATRSNVVLPPYPYDPYEDWGTYETEIIAGIIPKGEWVFIDPNIPGNETDKLKGRRVFARGIAVYGKATVEVPNTGKRLTAYCRQELQVRDAPLFSHAIFYNMDMEIALEPAMDITGPVHVNGDAYIQANSSLDFYGQVTIAGDLHHGRHPDSGKSDSTGSVKFLDDSADPIANVEFFSSTTSSGEEVVTSGLRDKRRGKAVDLVELDVGKLKTLVHNNDEADWGGASEQKPESWWNGVVFVEFPDGASVTRNDKVQPSVDGWG